MERIQEKSLEIQRWPRVRKTRDFLAKKMHHICRFVIALYCANYILTELQLWSLDTRGSRTFPYFIGLILPASFLVAFNLELRFSGLFLILFAFYHSGEVVLVQLGYAWEGYGFYFNELMVKRIAVTGCLALVYGRYLLDTKGDESAGITGLLLESRTDTMASKHSGLLLLARLFMAILFLWVGFGEIKRQLASVTTDAEGHTHHQRPEGDGHDEVWAKVAQFFLSMPFTIGLFTKTVAPLLSMVCFAEAVVQWQFWSSSAYRLGIGYTIHAREHFFVNVAVAGGLLLLQSYGAGKYSADAYLKKNE
jgi:alanyl-tRNA synthetase